MDFWSECALPADGKLSAEDEQREENGFRSNTRVVFLKDEAFCLTQRGKGPETEGFHPKVLKR